jgi:D-alanyl-D-alanine endopeptidase (penicillin-binding protein 7)
VVRHRAKRRVVHAARRTTHHVAKARARPIPVASAWPDLRANVAYVINPETNQVLFAQNANTVQPIASLTKLMTGLVIDQAQLPLDERITITDADVDRLKFSSSHLPVGTVLTRRQALHLALMASENRAAHALGRTYPGGMSAFVSAMNNQARQLGMLNTRYVEPTGLSSQNRSTAKDLAILAGAAAKRPLLREFSTDTGYQLRTGSRVLRFGTTDPLVRRSDWDIALQKTGFINEAGQCLLLHTKMMGRKLIMVFLDSAGRLGRIKDAEKMRAWLRTKLAHDPAVAASEAKDDGS